MLQVLGVGPEAAAHLDPFLRTLEGKFEDLVVDRFGDEIRGFQFEAVDGQFHVPMAGDHDHLGFGGFLFDSAQQFDAVHAGHLDIAQHDRRYGPVEGRQGFLTVLSRVHGVAQFAEVDIQNFPDIRLVIHQQYGSFHCARP